METRRGLGGGVGGFGWGPGGGGEGRGGLSLVGRRKCRNFIWRAVRQKARHVIIAYFLSHLHPLGSLTEGGFAPEHIKRLIPQSKQQRPLWEKASVE